MNPVTKEYWGERNGDEHLIVMVGQPAIPDRQIGDFVFINGREYCIQGVVEEPAELECEKATYRYVTVVPAEDAKEEDFAFVLRYAADYRYRIGYVTEENARLNAILQDLRTDKQTMTDRLSRAENALRNAQAYEEKANRRVTELERQLFNVTHTVRTRRVRIRVPSSPERHTHE